MTRGDNVKNELEQDKDPAKTRRYYVEIPIYTPKDQPQKYITVGVPDPREIKCFIDNNFEYHSHVYRVWRSFLQDTQRNPLKVYTRSIKRGRIIERGESKDVYLIRIQIKGINNRERTQEYNIEVGKYNLVTFIKNRDEKTGEFIAKSTDQFITKYDFYYDMGDPDSIAALKYWIDHGDNNVNLYCIPSIRGSESLPILDVYSFLNGNFAELLECGRRGILLSELHDLKAYYLAMQYGKGGFVPPKSAKKVTVSSTSPDKASQEQNSP
jgi:hypothetical protein